jgi:hypothetical protein
MTSTQPLATLYILAFDEVNMCFLGVFQKTDIHRAKQFNISFEKKSFKHLLVMTYSLIFVFCIVLISYSTLIPVSLIIQCKLELLLSTCT